jgi:hypothetical protein
MDRNVAAMIGCTGQDRTGQELSDGTGPAGMERLNRIRADLTGSDWNGSAWLYRKGPDSNGLGRTGVAVMDRKGGGRRG